MEAERPLLVYALHSGNLYGTERMAIATASALADTYECVMMAPDGPALAESRRLGFRTVCFSNARQFGIELWKLLRRNRPVAFFATGVMHSLICLAVNALRRRRIAHLHMVHGGAEESLSYGRKKRLNGKPVLFVAVSGYVRERLIANGVAASQITVIENFLTDERVRNAIRRPAFSAPGTPQLIVVSRLDPEKRVDLLLDALEQHPELAGYHIRVFGTGWRQDELRSRAKRLNLPIDFVGFHSDVAGELAKADLLVHLCPVEPFGLAILEAMTARIPVLVPDAGGAGSLVTDHVSGFRFRANDPGALAKRICDINAAPPELLNRVVGNAYDELRTRFSQSARIADYRKLIESSLA
jgi:glycosyltransferase involved in cell wall biosynthesis